MSFFQKIGYLLLTRREDMVYNPTKIKSEGVPIESERLFLY